MRTCRCGRPGTPHVKTNPRNLHTDTKILCRGCAIVQGYMSVEREKRLWQSGFRKK